MLNPLKRRKLTGVVIDVDSDNGDRTLPPFKLGPGITKAKKVAVAAGHAGKHCVAFGIEANEIFGLGWEQLLCYVVGADGSVKSVSQ